MYKVILILLSFIALITFSYIMVSFQNLKQTESYYGVISSDNETIKDLVSNDKVVKDYKLPSSNKFKQGDILLVELTDARGTIIEIKKISKKDIPARILKKNKNIFYNNNE